VVPMSAAEAARCARSGGCGLSRSLGVRIALIRARGYDAGARCGVTRCNTMTRGTVMRTGRLRGHGPRHREGPFRLGGRR
jgi:hypothetical protein